MRRRLLLFIGFCITAQPCLGQTPTVFNTAAPLSNDLADTGNGFIFTIPTPVLSGNTGIFFISYPNSVAAPTVTDDKGNTYTNDETCTNTLTGTPRANTIFRASNMTAGTQKVTFTFASSISDYSVKFAEVQNMSNSSPVDGTPACTTNQTPSTNALPNINSGSITTLSAGDLVLNFVADDADGHFGDGNAIGPMTTTTQSRVATDTTVTITDGTGSANGDCLIWEAEVVCITAGGGTNTLTLNRHQQGTTAASHASGTTLVQEAHTKYGSGFTGLFGDSRYSVAGQYIVQGSAGAINPGMTVFQATHDAFDSVSIAYKAAANGTAPAAGLRLVCSMTTEPNVANTPFVFPCPGANLILPFEDNDSGTGGNHLPAITDNTNGVYSEVLPGGAGAFSQFFHADNSTAPSGLAGQITNSTVGNIGLVHFQGWTGAKSSGPVDTALACPAPSTLTANGDSCTNSGTIAAATTTTQSRIATDTTVTIAAAAGIANNDFLMWESEVVKVTAGGGTTTLTISRGQRCTTAASHASGTSLIETNITNAPNITPSTSGGVIVAAINFGTGPVRDAVGATFDYVFYCGQTDGSRFGVGDGISHLLGASASAHTLVYTLQNGSALASWNAEAIGVKAAPASANKMPPAVY